jgi:hypothetical protein
MLSTLNGRKQQEKKKRNHTRTWNYEIVKLLEQRDKNCRAKEKRVEEFLLPCLDTLKRRGGRIMYDFSIQKPKRRLSSSVRKMFNVRANNLLILFFFFI